MNLDEIRASEGLVHLSRGHEIRASEGLVHLSRGLGRNQKKKFYLDLD